MKRTIIIIAAIAALALAGCSKENKDDADKNEISETVAEYLDYFTGTFHGEDSFMGADSHGNYTSEVYCCEDITFTPYDSPKEVSGVTSLSAYGEAYIYAYIVSEDENYINTEPQSFNCYYSITYLESVEGGPGKISYTPEYPLILYFYQYDPDTGAVTDSGAGHEIFELADENVFIMGSYYPFYGYIRTLTYTRE
ncbi:MAG: hypothetical protein LUC24_02150 [Bacteroidales bacterium]|nr:hypothetical protein [Bacteroidales bacterium]